MQNQECERCKLWDKAAKEAGYSSGICEDCFNRDCVAVNLFFDPNSTWTKNV